MVYDAAGTFAHQWDVTRGLLPPLRMPSGIVIDAQGAVYVTDSSTTARTSCRRQADDGVW